MIEHIQWGHLMDWQAIGAIGEIAGAAAVLVTLIYLSIQIRQNTKALVHASERGATEDAFRWVFAVVQDPELARLYRSGLLAHDLTPEEMMRFRLLMQMLFNTWDYAYAHGQFGAVAHSDVASVIATPGGKKYWERAAAEELAGLREEFRQFVDEVAAEVRPAHEGD